METPNKFSAWFAGRDAVVKWLVIFLFFTLIGVMNFNRFYTNELAEGGTPSFHHYFINEMTGAYAVLLLLPFLLPFVRKFPLQRSNWLRRLPAHMLASVIFGASHTMLMFLSRKLLYALLLQKNYDYGHLGYRLVMEYQHQFFTYWVIYGIAFFVNMRREHQQQKLKTAQLEQQLAAARLQALQMQLNPHFLFNTLNLISSTMYDDVNAADKMMASLSDLLRKTLNVSNRQQHSLRNEMELVNLYIEMMQARFQNQLAVTMSIEHTTLEALVPSFILQPLVENSIKHAMTNAQTAEIEIRSRQENARLLLSVKDNGPGIQKETSQNGVGLSNTAERLEKLYGADHRFHLMNNQTSGLTVMIDIPFHVEKNDDDRP
jgi:two-component system LytT family sensor kinase